MAESRPSRAMTAGAVGDWEPRRTSSRTTATSATEEETLVGLVHLLQEDEGEDSMGAQTGIVWCEALPQAEETLIADDLHQHILDRQGRQSAGARTWSLGFHPLYPFTIIALPRHTHSPKPPALLPHQPILVFRLPIDHSHVLDPGEEVGA